MIPLRDPVSICTPNFVSPAVLPRAGSRETGRAPVPVIAGTSLITPLGLTADETWNALLSGAFLPKGGRIPISTSTTSPRAVELGMLAATGAVGHVDPDLLRRPDAALVVGTSKGSIDPWTDAIGESPTNRAIALNPAGLGDIAAAVGHSHRMTGPRLTVSAACASGLVALVRAAMLVRSGEVKRVLVVAAESSFSPVLMASYRRMGVVADDETGCRPFDRGRRGFVVAEAAAAVLLEAATPEEASGQVRIDAYALGGDATHLTGADPDGSLLRDLLSRVIANGPVDFVHAHGTGTVLNDPVELAAIESSLPGDDRVPVYSHKAALGHTLGAAGLVSVVLSTLMHRHGTVPPNVRTPDPIPSRRSIIASDITRRRMTRSVALAAGFGGATAAVTLASGPLEP